MKKSLLILLAALSLFLGSCSKDEVSGRKVSRTSLDGTVWIAKETKEHLEFVLKFYRSTFQLSGADGNEVESGTGEYKYDYPYVWLTLKNEKARLTIEDGNKMVAPLDDNGTAVFILQ